MSHDAPQPACLALSHKDEAYGVGHMLLRYWNTPTRKGYSRENEPATYSSVDAVLHSLPLRFENEENGGVASSASNASASAAGASADDDAVVPSPSVAAMSALGFDAAPTSTDNTDDLIEDMSRFF